MEKLELIGTSLSFFVPEFALTAGIILIICLGLIKREKDSLLTFVTILFFAVSFLSVVLNWQAYTRPSSLFSGMLRSDDFSAYLKLLFDFAAMLSVLMTWRNRKNQIHLSEYYALMLLSVAGMMCMAAGFDIVLFFIGLELMAISTYVLVGFLRRDRRSNEAALKYLLLGAFSSAFDASKPLCESPSLKFAANSTDGRSRDVPPGTRCNQRRHTCSKRFVG